MVVLTITITHQVHGNYRIMRGFGSLVSSMGNARGRKSFRCQQVPRLESHMV
ncbi:unnamed protein product [Linum tenue]|uniref:Uncharacterized protein n=1 Tax=Linum tenue TaxID=586396 RepID=A0AAV0QPK4_9ROSI|nr:unnamed protein product [Linum tenue]